MEMDSQTATHMEPPQAKMYDIENKALVKYLQVFEWLKGEDFHYRLQSWVRRVDKLERTKENKSQNRSI